MNVKVLVCCKVIKPKTHAGRDLVLHNCGIMQKLKFSGRRTHTLIRDNKEKQMSDSATRPARLKELHDNDKRKRKMNMLLLKYRRLQRTTCYISLLG